MNIGVGKVGKSTLFDYTKWGMIGGDQESPVLISSLAQLNPNVKFYIIGRSDFGRISPELRDKINVHGNIIDIWADFDQKKHGYDTYVTEFLEKNNIRLDFCLLYSGTVAQVNVPNKSFFIKEKPEDPGAHPKVLEVFLKYASGIIHYLNTSGTKFAYIGEDYRYFPIPARDLYNRPFVYLGTIAEKGLKVKYAKEYCSHDMIITTEKVLKAHMDKVFLMGEEKPVFLENEKPRSGMAIYSNGKWASGGTPKWPILDAWIINQLEKDSWTVYGEWAEDVIEKKEYVDKFINTPISQLHDQMRSCKYTFMIPITKRSASSKFWKMIYFGLVPFFQPDSDSDDTQLQDEVLNKWLRPQTPAQLREHIDAIDADENLYLEIRKRLHDLMLDEYFNGELMNKILLKGMAKLLKVDDSVIGGGAIECKLSSLFDDKNAEILNIKKVQSLF